MKKVNLSTLLFVSIILVSFTQTESIVNQQEVAHPDWSYNSSIYEVNIRQFTPEGTFSSFMNHLTEIRDLGIDILWLMPINPIGEENRKGTLGSYYSVKDYLAINPNFGNEKDFKTLVDSVHALGMHIIIDWVANHTAWDNVWVKTHPDFYNKNSRGFFPPVEDWNDVIDLNYNNDSLRIAMINALKYWVEKFNIDGFRCDVAELVPLDFWKRAKIELDKIKPMFMLAEGSKPALFENGFDMTYNWKLKDIMNNYAIGKAKINDIKNRFLEDKKEYSSNSFLMNFTSNHDENSWSGSAIERLGNYTEPFAVLISTAKGMPLIYNGQEAGLNKKLEFFEKDLIPWENNKLREIYSKILNEKKMNKSMWNGSQGGEMNFIETGNEKILSYYREKDENFLLVILNLSDQKQVFVINNDKEIGSFKNLITDEKVKLAKNEKITLDAFNYLIFTN
jgi:cyclomaltodextrinase / maltogenic alpha-amylase / neopullulanase